MIDLNRTSLQIRYLRITNHKTTSIGHLYLALSNPSLLQIIKQKALSYNRPYCHPLDYLILNILITTRFSTIYITLVCVYYLVVATAMSRSSMHSHVTPTVCHGLRKMRMLRTTTAYMGSSTY